MIKKNTTATKIQSISKKIDNLNYGNTNLTEKGHPSVIDIDKATKSDLRLGFEKWDATAFTDFLSNYIINGTSKNYSLFILGDLWDFWRKHDIVYSRESDEILSLINQFKGVYYLPGNHDHITLDAAQNYPGF